MGKREWMQMREKTKKTDRIPCTVMRGGTSKGVFFYEEDIPPAGEDRDKFLCAVMGSPDNRQIDGLGGADPLTSKVAIVSKSERPDADINYTFAQVSIDKATVDYRANCGNITSAVGLFAVEEGFVPSDGPVGMVRIYNTNTDKILNVYVPCTDGYPEETGTYSIDGVPGVGPKLDLDFSGTAGAASGKLLPTGNLIDTLEIPGYGKLEATVVDIANPVVFVRASDLGLGGSETPEELKNRPEIEEVLEKARSMGAQLVGLVDNWEKATAESPAVPLLAIVSAPVEKDVSLVCRLMFMQTMHKAYSGTASICTGVAARIPGTIPYEYAEQGGTGFSIGHPAGIMDIDIDVAVIDGKIEVKKGSFGRTARRLMDGWVYITKD